PTRGAPRPAEGNGVRPTSFDFAAGAGAAAGLGAGGGGGAAGAAVGRSWTIVAGLAPVGRLPNTLRYSDTALRPLSQFIEQRRQQAGPLLLGLAAAGQLLRQLTESLGGAMSRRNLRDHLSVIGGGAENLRLERDHRDRRVLERLGKIRGLDFRPLRHPDLVEAIARQPVVRPGGLEEIVEIFGVAKVGKVGR